MSEKIRTATVRDIDNYLSDDAEVCAWEDVKNVLDAKNKEIAELNDKLQNVSSLLKETREWLVESQKLHKRCADNAVKVIAELQKQVHDYAQGLYVMQARAEKEARHHKYKRCLAMALWFSAEIGVLEFFCGPKIKYYKRWQKRWLKLAEQFKEEK